MPPHDDRGKPLLLPLDKEEVVRRALCNAVPIQYVERPVGLAGGLMNDAAVGSGFFKLCQALVEGNNLDNRLRELVVLRSAWRSGGRYILAQHLSYCRQIGMSDEEIFGIEDPVGCSAYSPLDLALIKMADELHETATISEETRAVLKQTFSPDELVVLLISGGFWRMACGFLNSAEIPVDEHLTPWPAYAVLA